MIKIVRILEREIITAMRGLGVASIKDLKPEMASRPDFPVQVTADDLLKIERVDWEPLPRAKL